MVTTLKKSYFLSNLFNIYLLFQVHGAFNKVPDFFVLAFKIVVDA